MAPIAEHVISQLCASYIKWGGLNGADAGGGAMASAAKRIEEDVWRGVGRLASNIYTKPLVDTAWLYMADFTLDILFTPGIQKTALREIKLSEEQVERQVEEIVVSIERCFTAKTRRLEAEHRNLRLEIDITELEALCDELDFYWKTDPRPARLRHTLQTKIMLEFEEDSRMDP